MPYFLFNKYFGHVRTPAGEIVTLQWVTIREESMVVPAGSVIKGKVLFNGRQGLIPREGEILPRLGEYYGYQGRRKNEEKSVLELLMFAFKLAWRKKQEADEKVSGSMSHEVLNFLDPHVVEDYSEGYDGPKYVVSFREDEAAAVAFRKGYRAIKDGNGQWSWPALGKLQEKEVTSA